MSEPRRCLPCRADTPKLSAEQVSQQLAGLPGWSLTDDGSAISRRFRFRDFDDALAAVNAVGDLARHEDHHPDIAFGWGYAVFTLTTHAIGGLHGNDFIMAAGIDALIEA